MAVSIEDFSYDIDYQDQIQELAVQKEISSSNVSLALLEAREGDFFDELHYYEVYLQHLALDNKYNRMILCYLKHQYDNLMNSKYNLAYNYQDIKKIEYYIDETRRYFNSYQGLCDKLDDLENQFAKTLTDFKLGQMNIIRVTILRKKIYKFQELLLNAQQEIEDGIYLIMSDLFPEIHAFLDSKEFELKSDNGQANLEPISFS